MLQDERLHTERENGAPPDDADSDLTPEQLELEKDDPTSVS
jgi:hypothetical protein